MQFDQWPKIKELLNGVMELDPALRDAWLQTQCTGDKELLDEIQSLLREQEDEALLEVPAPDKVAQFLREHRAEAGVGRHVGKFNVTGVLGYGGMGVVYRATQENPRREVALKIIPSGPHASPYQLKLFRREVRSLARMQHAGIAALFEAGSAEDGQHYFAMELVQGLPLLEYATEHQLDLRARLVLFGRVCEAVHYAHQKGVIHRDIKPSNILVSEAGQPKLLDFGLAKLTEHDNTSVSTAPSRVQGTLSYMSPEQAMGSSSEIDIRSDVYSLGVVLFELLSQRRPFDLTQRTVPQAIDIICHKTAPMAGTIRPDLRGDVETMIAKALEKDPQRRYQSAHALVEDIRRFLANQPITARPPSAIYQLRKFTARHKLPVAFAAVLAFVVSVSALVATALSFHLAREKDAALTAKQQETEARQSAEQVVEFLVELFESGDPGARQEATPTVRELLEAGATRVQTELANQPLVQARLMTALGSVFGALGEYDRSLELLETALATREKNLGGKHPDVAVSLFQLNFLFEKTQDCDRGFEHAQRAAEIYLHHYGEESARHAEAIEYLGSNRFYANDFVKAAEYFRKCLEIRTKLTGEANLSVADALQNLGLTLAKLNAPDEAEPVLRKAFSIQRDLHADPVKAALTLDALAHVAFARGDSLATEQLLKEELDFSRANLHEKHTHVAFVLDNYATLVRRNHGPEQAEPLYREAMSRYQAALGHDHVLVARQLNFLGLIRKDLGDIAGAESFLEEALRIRHLRLGMGNQLVAESEKELGLVIESAGRLEEAAALLEESYLTYASALGPDHAVTMAVAKDMEKLHRERNQPEEASKWQERNSITRPAAAEAE